MAFRQRQVNKKTGAKRQVIVTTKDYLMSKRLKKLADI